jgi:predicted transcriptional regulator of viral defense system
MERSGEIVRLSRGLYQLADAPIASHHSLAEAAKRLPKGVVRLISALAFQALTDQLPHRTWMAIGAKNWAPVTKTPPLRIVRFSEVLLSEEVETHTIEGVPVRIFGVPKTIADCFRHRRSIGLSIAIEGLQETLRQRKATPAELSRQADRGGVATVMRPYLGALTNQWLRTSRTQAPRCAIAYCSCPSQMDNPSSSFSCALPWSDVPIV